MNPTMPRLTSFAAGLLVFGFTAAGVHAGEASGSVGSGNAGPDVTVYSLSDVGNYTSGGAIGGLRAYSVGTVSCNIGSEPLNWCDNNGGCNGTLTWNQHPVIAQNLYRHKNGRFEQLGKSWLKHGFVSTNSFANDCRGSANQTCVSPPFGGNQLGVGCTDPYGSGLNGSRPLGMRSEVNAATGSFPFPETVVSTSTALDQRLVVADADVDPALNAGARWWVEGQYVADNDALADNGVNNASYREVIPGATAARTLAFSGGTVRERSAMYAWQVADPLIELIDVDVVVAGLRQRFEVGRKVTEPTPGNFHYEYAIRNMTSDLAGRRFEIDFEDGVVVTNVGFKDVDSHSGEFEPDTLQPMSSTDWTSAIDSGDSLVSWETQTFSIMPEANALRWGTMYNFWFDTDAGPDQIELHTLRLFKPGTPDHVDFWGSQLTAGLDVTVSGDGSVVSDPAGIDCPSSACSHAFLVGTAVELTATAAAGSTFVGWSGACSGTGTCDLTMDDAESVTATFDTMPFLDGFESSDTSQWSSTTN